MPSGIQKKNTACVDVENLFHQQAPSIEGGLIFLKLLKNCRITINSTKTKRQPKKTKGPSGNSPDDWLYNFFFGDIWN